MGGWARNYKEQAESLLARARNSVLHKQDLIAEAQVYATLHLAEVTEQAHRRQEVQSEPSDTTDK